MKLNIGCKHDWHDGYLHVDLYWPGAERVDDAVTLATFEDASVEEIRAAHLLEHLARDEAPVALRRWHQVLQPGGKLVVIVPDVVVSIRRWLEAYDAGDPALWRFKSWCLWGMQTDPGEFHKWGYDAQTLRQVIEAAGFVRVTVERCWGIDGDLRAWVPDRALLAIGYRP